MSAAYWVGNFFEYLRGVGHMQFPKEFVLVLRLLFLGPSRKGHFHE